MIFHCFSLACTRTRIKVNGVHGGTHHIDGDGSSAAAGGAIECLGGSDNVSARGRGHKFACVFINDSIVLRISGDFVCNSTTVTCVSS